MILLYIHRRQANGSPLPPTVHMGDDEGNLLCRTASLGTVRLEQVPEGGTVWCGTCRRILTGEVVYTMPRKAAERAGDSGRKRRTMSEFVGEYVIVRTYSAGVFAGTLVSRDGREVVMADARRIWYWAGAASLSELAVRGTSRPNGCKFPLPVPKVLLTEAIEILPVTPEARASIEGVPVWGA